MSEQDDLWRGPFGDAYQQRSPGDVQANAALLARALRHILPRSAIEFGAGTGANLEALRYIFPLLELTAVELNHLAAERLLKSESLFEVFEASILDVDLSPRTWELAFTKGLLIHIAPENLPRAYDALYAASSSLILVAEYYNPTPVSVPYRGQGNALWKRDFAGEMLDRFPDLQLLDYGFVYHRDEQPQDDLTWMLMEKRR